MLPIEIRDVSLIYDTPGGKVPGVKDVSFDIGASEFICIVGPSGCGKSTLLNIIAGFLAPASGEIRIGGKTVTGHGMDRGVVFQDFAQLFPWRTALGNVTFGLEMKGVSKQEREAVAHEQLRLVKLDKFTASYPHHLSGGMQQRVSIARAFVNHPPLLVCDEPTGNLDPDTSVGIMQLLYRINRTGTTILMVTHDREMVDKMRKRVIALEGGKLVRDERRGGYTEE